MSAVGRTLREIPPARGGLLDRVAARLLAGALADLDRGTLVARLPDGTERRFGSGPAETIDVADVRRLIRRIATRGPIGLGADTHRRTLPSPGTNGGLWWNGTRLSHRRSASK